MLTRITQLSLIMLLTTASISSAKLIPNIHFQHLSRADGLSQSQVYKVVQDSDGYMWFATQQGLNRFDGYDITVFSHDPNIQGSISDNAIRTLLVDGDGVLWIGSDNGGLSKYNPIDESFTNYISTGHPDSISTNRVRVIYEDSQRNFWVGTDGGGLELFDRRTGKFIHPEDTRALFSNERIWAIQEDLSGNLWVGTEAGLNRFEVKTGKVLHFSHDARNPASISTNHIKSLALDKKGALWIGTDKAGINKLDTMNSENATFDHFAHDPQNESSLSDNRITNLYTDSKGRIWVGTFDGLNRLDADTGKFLRYRHNLLNRRSISNNNIMSIYQDRGGVMWIGTYDGLSRWNQATEAMAHYAVSTRKEDSVINATITSFAESENNQIWIGTFNAGLHLFNTGTQEIERITIDPNSAIDQVMALHVDSTGNLWLGTRSHGLSLRRKGTDKFIHFRHDPDNSNSLSANTVTSIAEDNLGNILIGTYTAGINLLNPDTRQIQRFQHEADQPESISSNRVLTIFKDSEQKIWVGTYGGGLNLFDTASGEFHSFKNQFRNPVSLSGNNVLAINEDEFGDFWIGTHSRGLNRWSRADRRQGIERFQHYSETNGLAGSSVYAIAKGNKQIWFSSNRGLSQYSLVTNSFRHLDISHGLQDAEFNQGAAITATNGKMYFGGINGFNSFHPDALNINSEAPQTVITMIASRNQRIKNVAMVQQQGLQLAHDESSLEFQFAGTDYSAPQQINYRYRLKGLDDHWIEAGNRRYASFTNLSHGSYVFQVAASNIDGVWNKNPTNVQIKIAPPPWLTWYAYFSYFMAFLTLCWVVYRVQAEKNQYTRELARINKELEREVSAGKTKEIALQVEKEKTQSYLDTADIIMIVINSNGLIQLINQTGCRILGSDEDQLVGQPLLRYVHSESQEEMKKWISGDLSEDIDTHYESSVVAADQSVSHIMWRFSFMQDETGEGAFLLASGMDVTDKRELEQAIQMKEKLAAIGTMASGIAHDFNNILTAIYGYSQLAVDQVEKPAASKEFLFRVLDATERAKELVARLLSVSKPADNDFQPCDLEPILEEVIALSKATLPPGVKMAVELDSDLKPVKADSTQIHQLLMNLITNAGKAMQDGGGMLEVSAGNIYLSEDDLPAHSDLIAGDHIRLIVKDSGIGMKQELLTTIFDPFFSSTGLGFGNDEGTGLGLSIAHGVVSGHNGHISVESKPGIGSVFTVILPCCADNLIYPKKGPDETVDSEGHILIIDDEARVADVCRQLLKVLGYSTTCYLNPLKALEEFKRNPDAFDLVICDQKMPRMLGTELLDEIRKYNSTVPTILMSGNLSPLEVLDPATAYMRKPFTITDLKQHVTKSLTKKLERST